MKHGVLSRQDLKAVTFHPIATEEIVTLRMAVGHKMREGAREEVKLLAPKSWKWEGLRDFYRQREDRIGYGNPEKGGWGLFELIAEANSGRPLWATLSLVFLVFLLSPELTRRNSKYKLWVLHAVPRPALSDSRPHMSPLVPVISPHVPI